MAPSSDQRKRFPGHQYPQVIPEVEFVQAGAPAPWSLLPPSRRMGFSMAEVRRRLGDVERLLEVGGPPEVPVELSIVADASPVPVTVRSAVLVALFEEDGEAHVVLTRRSLALRHHRGEVALPGGRSEAGESDVETALREAFEEVGLRPELVAPTAWLSPIVTFASGSSIWPVVGLLSRRPTFVVDPLEVDRVFTVALRDLVSDGAFLEERWHRSAPRRGSDEDGYFPIFFFKVPEDVIWGATARVLCELLCLMTGVAWPLERGL